MYSEAIEAQAGMLQHVRRLGLSSNERAASHLYKGTVSEYQPALRRVQLTLEAATPFYWDHDLCSVLEACAPSMPDWELKAEDLPARTGFVHFARPLRLPMPPEEVIQQAIEGGRRSRDIPLDYRLDMVGMGWQVLDADEVFICNFLMTSWRPAGEPGLLHITQEGMTLSGIIERLARVTRNEPMYADATHDDLMNQRAELQVRYIAAAFDFVNQPLLTIRRHQQPDRATRRRAQRENRLPPPDVQIIELRRKEYLDIDGPDDAPAESDREYRHRWMVGLATGGYWQRYHVGTGRTATIRRLILPYMKLADRTDLPIKPPKKTVIVVDR